MAREGSPLLPATLFCALALAPAQETPPPQAGLPRPLEEIVRHFAEKELEYARAHAQYNYRLAIKIQEIDGDGSVRGEFREVIEASVSPTGRRIDRIVEGPASTLQHLGIQKLELFDLSEVPLFTVSPEDLTLYRFEHVGSERLDEVDTFIFRATPTVQPRDKMLFEGLLWVDAEKLDVVKAFGRSVPSRRGGVVKNFFPRVEVYREPVDAYLFPTFVQGDDILRVLDEPLRARIILRFSDHKRAFSESPN